MRLGIKRTQAGFSLLELSVAAAIYSMGLGSVSLMLMLAVQGTSTARLDTAAALHAASLAEAIAMSSDAVGHYIHPVDAEPCAPGSACSMDQMAAWNLGVWKARVAADLPQGTGLVCRDATPTDGNGQDAGCDGSGPPVIKVFWQTAGDDASQPKQHRHVSRLPMP